MPLYLPLIPAYGIVRTIHKVLAEDLGQAASRGGDGELVPPIDCLILGLKKRKSGWMSNKEARHCTTVCTPTLITKSAKALERSSLVGNECRMGTAGLCEGASGAIGGIVRK